MKIGQLQKLRKQLPYHYAPMIAKRSGIAVRSVRRVFNGEITNQETINTVVEVACAIRDESLNNRKALINRIQTPKKVRA
jgi:hypothetical protein